MSPWKAIALVVLVYPCECLAVNFLGINLAWQYNPDAEIRVNHRVVQSDERMALFVSLKGDSLVRWEFDFFVQHGYKAKAERKIDLQVDTLLTNKNRMVIKLSFEEVKEDLFFFKIHSGDIHYYYDILLKVGELSFPSIYPLDSLGVPITENYIHRSGYYFRGSDFFYGMKYREKDAPADLPMAEMKPMVPSARMEEAFSFEATFEMEDHYYYVIRSDSTAPTGVTLLKTPPYFPKYRKLTELTLAMLYLVQEREKESMLYSNDLKKSFDSFWLNNFATKQRARQAIRSYYRSIEEANILFTDFKAGWKSDRGMIYVIFGKPDEVYRSNGTEKWRYDEGDVFEFSVISSFFASRTYSLQRNLDLEEKWNQRIATLMQRINE